MFLANIIAGIKNTLTNSGTFKIVETYEGQLEDISNFIIKPPHAFIEIDTASNQTENFQHIHISINIYIATSHMKTKQNLSGMYDILENTINLLHDSNIQYKDNTYDKIFFRSFNRLGIIPGLAIYKLNFAYSSIQ